MKDTPENRVKQEVKDWLDFKGFFNFPITQGLGSYKGIPDRIAIKDGVVLFIECKSKDGSSSNNQLNFQHDLVTHGGYYVLARGYEDVWEVCEKLCMEV